MNVGFIGSGRMAEAMMAALIRQKTLTPAEILASDVSAERRSHVRERYGVAVTLRNADVLAHGLVVVLAVKPQQLDAVLGEVAPHATAGHLFLSIAAGKRTAHLEALLPRGRVVRVMPNLACLVGESMSVFARGARSPAGDAAVVAELLGACGRVRELPEALFDTVTALSGSGPAFFAYLLDRLVDGAVAEGLAREDALALAEQTMLGTARLLLERRFDPAELAAAVTSARGTTAAGRAVLEIPPVAEALQRTIRAAAQRSRELSRA
jgi:pyrroline-5-carboxylate reductase